MGSPRVTFSVHDISTLCEGSVGELSNGVAGTMCAEDGVALNIKETFYQG
jgi:hypothetical protein